MATVLVLGLGAILWIAFAMYWQKEGEKERLRLLEKEKAIKDRVHELKNKAWRFLTFDELKYIRDNTSEDDFITFCVKVIMAGNKIAISHLKEIEGTSHYATIRGIESASVDFIKFCNLVMETSPDTHWALLLGDKQRENGDAVAAIKAYQRGIMILGEDVNDKQYHKNWKWLDKAWKGQLPKRRGRRPPPADWRTVAVWRCTDLEACYFGLEICNRHIQEEQRVQFLDKIESEAGYNLVTTGIQYEQFVAGVIKRAGFSCEMTPVTDQGVDIVVLTKHSRVAVQCKYYSEPVSNSAVQEVVAGKALYKCNYACVVSNSTFTSSAKVLAKANGVRLLHHGDVIKYLSEINR